MIINGRGGGGEGEKGKAWANLSSCKTLIPVHLSVHLVHPN